MPTALTVLRSMEPMRSECGPVFPGIKPGRGLSDQALAEVLQRLGYSEITVHGFRSSFRDWAAEATSCPNHLVEMALAHAIGSGVERAYRRGDLMSKRTALMSDWAAFLARPTAEVVPLSAARATAHRDGT